MRHFGGKIMSEWNTEVTGLPGKDKKGKKEIYPSFKVCKSKDLMIRGGDFYAIWDEENGMWSTDEDTAIRLIDNEIGEFATEFRKNFRAWLDTSIVM